MTTTHSATFCLALGASLLGLATMPLLAQASLLQPPISAWSPATAQAANPAPSPSEATVTPAPAAPAPVAVPASGTPAPIAPKVAKPIPAPAARQDAVQRLFAFQADGVAAGAMQPISGPEAIASYKAWLRTFANQQQSSGKPAASGIGSMAQQLPSSSAGYGN